MADISISQHVTCAMVERLVEEREAQLLALAMGICSALDPALKGDSNDDSQHAWRLSQVLEAELSSTKFRDSLQRLMGHGPEAAP